MSESGRCAKFNATINSVSGDKSSTRTHTHLQESNMERVLGAVDLLVVQQALQPIGDAIKSIDVASLAEGCPGRYTRLVSSSDSTLLLDRESGIMKTFRIRREMMIDLCQRSSRVPLSLVQTTADSHRTITTLLAAATLALRLSASHTHTRIAIFDCGRLTSGEPAIILPPNWKVRMTRSAPQSTPRVPQSCCKKGFPGDSGLGTETLGIETFNSFSNFSSNFVDARAPPGPPPCPPPLAMPSGLCPGHSVPDATVVSAGIEAVLTIFTSQL